MHMTGWNKYLCTCKCLYFKPTWWHEKFWDLHKQWWKWTDRCANQNKSLA